MRLLGWLVLGVLVFLALRSRTRTMKDNLRASMQAEFDAQSAAKPAAPSSAPVENMVSCAYCQLYLPVSEALTYAEHEFCCEEHLRLFVQKSASQSAQ